MLVQLCFVITHMSVHVKLICFVVAPTNYTGILNKGGQEQPTALRCERRRSTLVPKACKCIKLLRKYNIVIGYYDIVPP